MFNFYKAIPDKTKKIISIILLVLLSVLINQYYGNNDADGQFVAITAEQLQTNLFV